MRSQDPEDTIQGISPLGGNALPASGSSADADRTSTDQQEVPLAYDSISGEYVAEHRVIDQQDREEALQDAERYASEEEFRAKAGFINTVT